MMALGDDRPTLVDGSRNKNGPVSADGAMNVW